MLKAAVQQLEAGREEPNKHISTFCLATQPFDVAKELMYALENAGSGGDKAVHRFFTMLYDSSLSNHSQLLLYKQRALQIGAMPFLAKYITENVGIHTICSEGK